MPSKSLAVSLERTAQPIIGLTLLTLSTFVYPNAGLAQLSPARTSSQPSDSSYKPGSSQPNFNQLSSNPARSSLLNGNSFNLAQASFNQSSANTYIQPETPYTLGAGDRIRIDIFQVPQYSGETDVLINGSINLPLVGSLSVGGLTLEQASAAIARAYSQYLRRPITTVSLINHRPVQVGIAGEVSKPGSYTIAPANGGTATLTQLLQAAGGTTQIANIRQVQIRRPQRSGIEQVLNVNLWQLVQNGDKRYDVSLRDGDSVYIPAGNVDLAEAPLLANTSFSADQNKPINIAVTGEVFRPGPYTISSGASRTAEQAGAPGNNNNGGGAPTVTRAIQLAGGIRPMANIKEVEIRRLTRSGSEQVFKVNLWKLLQEADIRQDVALQEGDTITIPTATALDPTEQAKLAAASFSPDKIKINVVGEVTRPGVVEVPPNTPLNQGILAAGGFNNRANKHSVDLVRLNLDGTASKQRITVDYSRGINETQNPALHNNDVIIVRRNGLASISDTLGTILAPVAGAASLISAPINLIRLFGGN